MKKILIVLVALATATVVNAASVSWSINTTLNDVNFEAVEGTVAFYLTSAIGTNLSGSPLALSGGELSGTIEGEDQTSWTARITISNFAGESKSYYLDYVFDMDSITHSGTPDAATYLTALSAELSDAFTLGGALDLYASPASQGFTAVPEPTSGLLILLGMAGLALKRKRA